MVFLECKSTSKNHIGVFNLAFMVIQTMLIYHRWQWFQHSNFRVFSISFKVEKHGKMWGPEYYIYFLFGVKRGIRWKSWIMVRKLYLNERKYYNEVTIPYSPWNEPLSTLINQQDPAMRAFKDYIACFFFSINFPEMKMFKIVQQTGWAGKALSATFVKCTWSFLTSYVVESYLEGAASNSKLWLKLWLKC